MEIQQPSILIVDDEPSIVTTVEDYLDVLGYPCTATTDPRKALDLIRARSFDLVITDLMMDEIGGMDILNAARSTDGSGPMVVLMTAFPTVENAVTALQSGAEEFLLKPFSLDALEMVVSRTLARQQLARENVSLKESLALYRASEALEAPLDLPEYLELVLQVAVEELGGRTAELALFEGEGETRVIEHRIRRGPESRLLVEGPFRLEALAEQLDQGSGPIQEAGGDGGNPLLAIPLRAGGDPVGLIAVCRDEGTTPFTPAEGKALAIIGSGAAVAVKNARLYNTLQEQYLRAIRALVVAVEAKDPYTSGHSEMVSRYAAHLARQSGYADEFVEALRIAGLLHDAGKIGVPEEVLLKKGSLTSEEYDVIKGHVTMSERIIEPLQLSEPIRRAVSEHHERLDGTGYPRGLKGDQISEAGRLLAIVDSFDAMTSDRVYRLRMSEDKALETLKRLTPEKLDAGLLEQFSDLILRRRAGEIDIPMAHA
jgi:putative nucleotidyltransferase with HDIG domain